MIPAPSTVQPMVNMPASEPEVEVEEGELPVAAAEPEPEAEDDALLLWLSSWEADALART